MTPDELGGLLNREAGPGDDSVPDDAEVQRRVTLLEPTQAACKKAWSENSPELVQFAEQLGTGSRDVFWRRAYGESGLVDLFLEALNAEAASQALKIQALRIIGNSCAETDENRARLVQDDRLLYISNLLGANAFLQFTVAVLYNSLVDYEPTQKLASQSKLSQTFIQLLDTPEIMNYLPVVPYMLKTLALLVAQDGEMEVADDKTVDVLLRLATTSPVKNDADDCIGATAVAVAYLANERFQTRFSKEPHTSLFITAFEQAFTLDPAQIEDEDTSVQLQAVYKALLNALADISSTDEFALEHTLSSKVPQQFLSWLKGSNGDLQASACLALGNLCRSDEASLALVEKYDIHKSLQAVLENPGKKDAQLLHASLSFLKNLAIPASNKLLLAPLLEPSYLPHIYIIDTMPHVQFAAMALTRILLVNSPSNVRQVCQKDASDGETTANKIITLFSKSDAEPTKMEGARSIGTICRALHSNPVGEILARGGSEDEAATRSRFYKEHEVTKPLSFLITQSKWPVLRSEAFFILALMSRSPEGAQVIASLLQQENALASLSSTMSGQKSEGSEKVQEVSTGLEQLQLEPQQVSPTNQADTSAIDRENALVLCTELLKNWNEEFPGKKEVLTDLLEEGTKLHIQHKTDTGSTGPK